MTAANLVSQVTVLLAALATAGVHLLHLSAVAYYTTDLDGGQAFFKESLMLNRELNYQTAWPLLGLGL